MNLLNRFFPIPPRGSRRSSLKTARRRRTIMSLESLEGRQLLSTFLVTSVTDSASPGSLRYAITQANLASGGSTIDFQINSGGNPLPNGDGDYYNIQLNSPLPTISKSVTLAGGSEAGYSGTPLIEISGSQLSSSAVGLKITSSNVNVEALSIVAFGGGGVEVSGANNVRLAIDRVGIDPAEDDLGNGSFGVEFTAGATSGLLSRSVISATAHGPGVLISGSGTTGIQVVADDIGTSPDGSESVSNQGDGVQINAGATSNTIGGSAGSQGNVISANTGNGVEISGSTTHSNFIDRNIIGLDSSGSVTALPNGLSGVEIDGGSTSNIVGGTSSGSLNVISGNLGNGVLLTGSGTSDNLVEGNYVGTTKNGLSIVDEDGNNLGNVEDGVCVLSGANSNTIGGSSGVAGNLISGNQLNGISLNGVDYTLVEGNLVGTDKTGTVGLGTQQLGVIVHNSAAYNTVGGTTSSLRNVVSGNTSSGVVLGNTEGGSDSGTAHNVVEGNYVGTNVAGSAAVANGRDGVVVEDGATLNTIGGTTSGACNVISGNANNGVTLNAASSNLVEGNYIGTNESGNSAIANQANGVAVENGATHNTVGGTTSSARNIISGNDGNGVSLTNAGTTGNVVEGDYIGTDSTGVSALGNGQNGVYADSNATGNTIGGTASGAGNIIAYNADWGILFVNANNTQTGNNIHNNGLGSFGEG
jgi:hypothetical protein